MSANIQGKVVVVTGASRSLGEATARHPPESFARAVAMASSFLIACGVPAPARSRAVTPSQPDGPPGIAAHEPAYAPTGAPGPALPNIVLLSAGEEPCGLDAGGRLWTWTEARMRAEEGISFPGAKMIACGISHACAIAKDDALWCWGGNSYGQLGDGTTDTRTSPVRVASLPTVAEVGVAGERTCARSSGGQVYCWGDSEFGKAGDGRMPDNDGREKTAPGRPILEGATSLAVGATCACAIVGGGRLSCWGQNHGGACGQPRATQYVPRPRAALGAADVVSVATGTPLTCAVARGGKVTCWGDLGVDGSPRETPVSLPAPAVEVGVGDRFACARLDGGAVHCWGVNSDGQLGDGSRDDRPQPVLVRDLPSALRIAIGINSVCALIAAGPPGAPGRVRCWGLHMADDGGIAMVPTDVVPEAM